MRGPTLLAAMGIAAALFACGSGAVGGGGDDAVDPDGGNSSGDGPEFSSGTGPYFTSPMFWNRDVSMAPKASYSDATIAALRSAGGWGNADTFQIDFSIDVLKASSSTPQRTFTKTADFYSPDCDDV
ncbi:MAG TPA: hypothetical protein VIV40_13225, partial [Kofleriaceae bacterium]